MTKRRIAKEIGLWIVTLFLALVCLRSGVTKLPGDSFWVRDFRRWGYPGWFRLAVGMAEIASFVLLLVPRFASYGAFIFAAVMLGAIFTHATHHEFSRLPFNLLLFALSLIIVYARLSIPRLGRLKSTTFHNA
ncbi:MAG TPA: DoxX family protein [Pyrinomonadaceae bacterium]|nr:DoxX family protein [Pyrinomonadaceae bacterium]